MTSQHCPRLVGNVLMKRRRPVHSWDLNEWLGLFRTRFWNQLVISEWRRIARLLYHHLAMVQKLRAP